MNNEESSRLIKNGLIITATIGTILILVIVVILSGIPSNLLLSQQYKDKIEKLPPQAGYLEETKETMVEGILFKNNSNSLEVGTQKNTMTVGYSSETKFEKIHQNLNSENNEAIFTELSPQQFFIFYGKGSLLQVYYKKVNGKLVATRVTKID